MKTGRLAVLAMLTVCAPPLAAQVSVGAQLVERGASADFANRVQAIVEEAGREGLPTEPLTAKAFEGWAKRRMVGPERIVIALEDLSVLLQRGLQAVRAAGVADPPGAVVSSAASGLGRGLTPEDVGNVIRAAPTPAAAAEGLQSAGSLTAQGLDREVAVRAVTDHFRHGGDPAGVLELPSAVSGMMGRGMPMSDIARTVMEGRGISLPGNPGQGAGAGAGGRPGAVPPARGNPDQGQGGQRQGHQPAQGSGQGGQGNGQSGQGPGT